MQDQGLDGHYQRESRFARPPAGSIEGNPRLNYFSILEMAESDFPPFQAEVELMYDRMRDFLEMQRSEAIAQGDAEKLNTLSKELQYLTEAKNFFLQDDPGGSIFQTWRMKRLTDAYNRRRSGGKASPNPSPADSKDKRRRKRRSRGSTDAASQTTSPQSPHNPDSSVFQGAEKGKADKKVGLQLPAKNLAIFNSVDDSIDSPTDRIRARGTRDLYSIPREFSTGDVDPEIWKQLGEAPPSQKILDAYSRYPPLPLDELKPFLFNGPATLLPQKIPLENITGRSQSAKTGQPIPEKDAPKDPALRWQDTRMDEERRRRLNIWRTFTQSGRLIDQRLLDEMKEANRAAHPDQDLNAMIHVLQDIPSTSWLNIALQRTLKAQKNYREENERFESGEATTTEIARRMNLEAPMWMQNSNIASWSSGITNMDEDIRPRDKTLALTGRISDIAWEQISGDLDWPAPPTAEQIKESKRMLARLQPPNPAKEKVAKEKKELTKTELRAQIQENEPRKWWLPLQRSWFMKLLFGKDERLVDGREMAAIVPKVFRFKPSVYKLDSNLEFEHVCSPGESYFEHLYFSDRNYIWPERLRKPPGLSARDRLIMKVQETDALKNWDTLPQPDKIPGVTPTDLPYDPELFNPPPKPRPPRNTDQGTEVLVRSGANIRPKFRDWNRNRQRERKQAQEQQKQQ